MKEISYCVLTSSQMQQHKPKQRQSIVATATATATAKAVMGTISPTMHDAE